MQLKKLTGKIFKKSVIYQDDKCVRSSTKGELKNETEKNWKKLNEASKTINEKKYKLSYNKVSYLGYQISDLISLDEITNQENSKNIHTNE